MIFCSSTASVLSSSQSPIPESVSEDPGDSDSLGYSQSKWVAEFICEKASKYEGMQGRVGVVRIGQLTGDFERGIWNLTEAWPRMFSTVEAVGCLPYLEGEVVGWVPVDVAACGVVDIAFAENNFGVRDGVDGDGECRDDNGGQEGNVKDTCPVYHLVANPTSSTPTWSDLLEWIQIARCRSQNTKNPFDIVPPQVWLDKLRVLDGHPAQVLLGLWDRAYSPKHEDDFEQKNKQGKDEGDGGGKDETVRAVRVFETARAKEASKAFRGLKDIDGELVGRIWRWLEGEIGVGSSK